MRSLFKYGLLAVEIAVAVACDNPMQPNLVAPQARDCESVNVISDSTTSLIPIALRCSRVRVVCG